MKHYIILLSLFSLNLNAETYRWTDELGKIHYSDQVPPDQAKQRRAQLNAQGREIGVVDVPKTPEQLVRDLKFKRLYDERKRILTEQKDLDESLLRSYQSEEEMNLALLGKMSSMDSAIKLSIANRQRQEEALQGLEKRAAEAEIKGAPVLANLRKTIEETRQHVLSYQEKTQHLELEKQGIERRFKQDIEHFIHLKESPHPIWFPSTEGSSVFVSCKPCDKAWNLAKVYVERHTNLPLITSNDRILQTAVAIKDKDMAITIVRLIDKAEENILFELNCLHSNAGDMLCESPEVQAILTGFKSFVEARN